MNPEAPFFDALVVGAGPAGSACAARLCERGMSVLLVDRDAPGRSRICGGFLGPEFEAWVRRWGWSEQWGRLPKSALNLVRISGSGSRPVESALPGGGGFSVDRGVFDRWIADIAVEKGARLETGARIVSAERAHGTWTVRVSLRNGAVFAARAAHWVDATGRRPSKSQADPFFACKAVYRGVAGPADAVALHFVERGHVGLNPLGNGEVTVCLCVNGGYLREAQGDLDGMMRRFFEANPCLKSQLEGARRLSAWQTCQAEPDGRPVFYRDGKFHAGDALSMVNPVIGGGIPIAAHSGILLADCLADARGTAGDEAGAARRFESSWRRAFAPKFRVGAWLGAAERSVLLSRILMAALAAVPALLGPIVRWSRPAPARLSAS